jgi:hypothetical protein
MPMMGDPGTVITITGTNFTGATAVSFGGRPATSFTIVSATQITAVVPSGAGDVITVTTPGGAAQRAGFVFSLAPRITAVAPLSAGVNGMIVINGINFTGVNEVLIGGVAAASFNVLSPTQITAIVSSEGASGDISISSPEGRSTFAGFTFIFPTPTISDFSPKIAGPGAVITLTGTGFLNVSTASFGGVTAASFAVANSRSMTAIVGSTGATGVVSVRTPGGTATLNGFTFVPLPVISSIAPPSAVPGTTITITGLNLAGVTEVRFGNTPAMFTIVSPTQITVVVSGNGAVSVTSPGGTTVSSAFTTIPPPTISGFSPAVSGSNATITISGFNFTGVSRVSFGGVTAASFRVLSPMQIAAVVGTGATGQIAVTATAGTATFNGYTFVAAPTITDISPRTSGSGQTITIRGTNLSTVQNVWFGGVTAASFSASSQTRIDAVLGAGASGSVTLATIGGTASTSGFVYVPAPVILSISPVSGEVGTTVTIIGRNFTGASAVRFGGLPAGSFRIVNDTLITAVVGVNSSNGTVSVVSTGGIGASTQEFRFVAPPPSITNFSPTTAGRGMEVIINGANFVNVREVRFGGVAAERFSVVSPRQITAIVSTGATGAVQIITQTGVADIGGFAFAPPPVITSFTPQEAGLGGEVTIDGDHFIGVQEVLFGGVTAASFQQFTGRIVAVVSTGATGAVSVRTIGGVSTRAGFMFIPAPTITDFTPTSTGGRRQVVINGTNFMNTSRVRFGGIAAISFEIVSPTRIIAIVAEGARSGAVSVVTPGGTASLDGFVFVEPPTVVGFTPLTAGPGSLITITGTNFSTDASVSFGGVASPRVTWISPTQLRAVVPQGTTGGTVAVTTLGGTQGLNGFSLLSPPRIVSFAPVRASSGTVITITGVNLTGASEVRFGGVTAANLRFISDTQVTAVVTTGASGTVEVTASSGTVALAGFSFIAPPVITGFTPRGAGAGLAVTIIGTNFTQASAVSFGGRPAARFTLISPTQITAIVGTGATGNVSITAEGGTGSAQGFTFLPAPTISSFTPSVGAVGTTLVLTGRGFTGVSSVVLGNVSVPFTVNSDTQVSLVIPLSGATSGTITVTSSGGVGISSQSFRYVPPPSITESSFVQSRQGFILRISGTNFASTRNVSVGQSDVRYTVVSPTQLTASIPPGASVNDVVTVLTQGGMARTVGMPTLPTITAVTPSRGRAGTRITITGRNLLGTTQASIGGVNLTPTVISSTQVTLTVPPEGVSGVIGLTTPFGVVSTSTNFTLITNAPLVTSFSPTRGDGGTVIQLFGENFATVTSVFIGGVPIRFRLISTSEMVLTIPLTGATSGNIVISSPTGVATSQERFTYTPGGVFIAPPSTPVGTVRTYPNPAASSMTIGYNLPSPQVVTIRIIDMTGNVVRVIEAGAKDAGEQSELVDVSSYARGVYLVSLETPVQRVQTMFLVMP